MNGLLILLMLLSPSLFAQSPWPSPQHTATTYILGENKNIQTRTWSYGQVNTMFNFTANGVALLLGQPANSVVLSPAYSWYNFNDGLFIMYRESFYRLSSEPEITPPQEVLSLMQKAKVTAEDLKGPNWIHLLKWIETEEARCLLTNNKDTGAWTGCPDPWQGGLQDHELACFQEKTYVKCHLECMEKIHQHKIEYQAGPCSTGVKK